MLTHINKSKENYFEFKLLEIKNKKILLDEKGILTAIQKKYIVLTKNIYLTI